MTQVTYEKNSPYYSTSQVTNYVGYLDFWNGQYILPQSTDTQYQLPAAYNLRPDLFSFSLYGTSALWWVFMLRNPNVIKDPVWDFVTGINIYAPSKDSLARIL
mgnify:CR=1 FL=1